jgi:hypothetical protein
MVPEAMAEILVAEAEEPEMMAVVVEMDPEDSCIYITNSPTYPILM